MKHLNILLKAISLIILAFVAYYGFVAYKVHQIQEARYIAPDELRDTASPNVHVLKDFIRVPYLGKDRTIRVYLPLDYYKALESSYPVIYFYDGQFLFNEKTVGEHEWQVDETMDKSIQGGNLAAIIVGIDHNAPDRDNEYNPFPMNHNINGSIGHGDKFAEFVVRQLKPRIDANFRTQSGPESSVIGGASFGANMAYYTLTKYPSIFHHALILSPALWASEEYWTLKIERQNIEQYKIYINVGEYEAYSMRRNAKRLFKSLTSMGMNANNLRLDFVENLDHTQLTWRHGFKKAYPWIFE